MAIALRWREEPFDCEFVGSANGGTLSIYSNGELAWQEGVASAVAAHDRAREIREQLLAPRAKQA
jgi:hypothetical protein